MTLATVYPETAPRFDCVQEKRRIQAEIYEDIKSMTWEQRHEYFRRGSEEFREKVERYRTERTKKESGSDI